ncbi:MAG: polysaccharide biosynthesis protein [Actinomycetota bacterium]
MDEQSGSHSEAVTPAQFARIRELAFQMGRDSLILVASFAFSLLLRFEFEEVLPRASLRFAGVVLPVLVVTMLVAGWLRGLYSGIPQYTGLSDLYRLGSVMVVVFVVLLVITEVHNAATSFRPMPRSVTVMGILLTFVGMGGVRIARRLMASVKSGKPASAVERVLIVGAGDAGEHVARDMLRGGSKFVPVGFLDDDPAKVGRRIHGLPVIGTTMQASYAVSFSGADHVLVALPSAPSRVLQEVLRRVSVPGVGIKVLPSLGELMGAPATAADIRDVDLADLIARSQVKVDMEQIAGIVDGKVVLITGAAGSIGSQLARQALRFLPRKLVLLDNDETDLYEVAGLLQAPAQSAGVELRIEVADIRHPQRVDRIFQTHRPQLVFHAAAYKQVPVMEAHPGEAVETNVSGTRHVARAAAAAGTGRFVLVSTDKAVRPAGVMGATKNLAEVVAAAEGSESMTVSSVRFGNVLASRGSVVPTFRRQIDQGGPITVTHREATRYFMTIEEAVSLIWQAAALANGRDIFVLEMGEPVRIFDLATRMREMFANGRADQIEIVVTGLRPGERLHEDIAAEGEAFEPVRPGILRAPRPPTGSYEDLSEAIGRLERLAGQGEAEPDSIRAELFRLVERRAGGPPA